MKLFFRRKNAFKHAEYLMVIYGCVFIFQLPYSIAYIVFNPSDAKEIKKGVINLL